jgi:NADH-quinone oxidoreductase subunit C
MTNGSDEKQKPAPPQADQPSSATPPSAPAGEAAAKPPAPAAPKPPAAAAPPKPPPTPALKPEPLESELTARYRSRFTGAILETWIDRKQSILVVAPEQFLEIAQYTRDHEKFDYLVDLTAVDWPKRVPRFDLVLNLYSFPKNERLRLKVPVAEGQPVSSVVSVWPTANWLEREVWDMFGMYFEGHPHLTRLLLPEEWQGFPLRKDYDILKQDEAWVRENLGIESGQ